MNHLSSTTGGSRILTLAAYHLLVARCQPVRQSYHQHGMTLPSHTQIEQPHLPRVAVSVDVERQTSRDARCRQAKDAALSGSEGFIERPITTMPVPKTQTVNKSRADSETHEHHTRSSITRVQSKLAKFRRVGRPWDKPHGHRAEGLSSQSRAASRCFK